MSKPFLYSPVTGGTFEETPYLQPYIHNVPIHSPFVPNLSIYQFSPSPSNPSTPGRIHFDLPADDLVINGVPVTPSSQRRPSWHAAASTPMVHTLASPYLAAPSLHFSPAHKRAKSQGDHPIPSPWSAPLYTPVTMTPVHVPVFAGIHQLLELHPLLDGHKFPPNFVFDMSLPRFTPYFTDALQRLFPVPVQDLHMPATHPPVTHLRIVCDAIPQWPIELVYQAQLDHAPLNAPTPISVGDVLIAIHRTLTARITHEDFARLNPVDERAVARAYTKRTRRLGADIAEGRGVMKVDYLKDSFKFKGLQRVHGEPGVETLRLLI